MDSYTKLYSELWQKKLESYSENLDLIESETYKKLDEIDTYMTAFVALNFIGFAFNYVGSCFIKEKKD